MYYPKQHKMEKKAKRMETKWQAEEKDDDSVKEMEDMVVEYDIEEKMKKNWWKFAKNWKKG